MKKSNLTEDEERRYQQLLADDYWGSEYEFWELHHKRFGLTPNKHSH